MTEEISEEMSEEEKIAKIEEELTGLTKSSLSKIVEFILDLAQYKDYPKSTFVRKPSLFRELVGCRRKRCYTSLKLANQAKRKYIEKYKVPMRVYECDICGNFHITTKMEVLNNGKPNV